MKSAPHPFFLLLAATCRIFSQDAVIAPTPLFQQPGFARDFVGSYGILSEIEPDVSNAEQQLLARIQPLFAQSKFREAEQEVTSFIREAAQPSDPKRQPSEVSAALVFVLGNLYFQSDRSDEARRAFSEAIRRFPKFRRAHTNLGLLHLSQNRVDEAMPSLQKAIELGEKSARVMGMLGYCHLSKQNAVAAETAYRQATLLDPASRDWKLGLAQALMQQEKYSEAVCLFDALIREFPADRQLWLRQTSAYISMNRKDEAVINLETMCLLKLDDEKSLGLLGNLYMDQSLPLLALSAYKAAMAKAARLDLAQALKSARILSDFGEPNHAAELISAIRTKLGANPPPDTSAALLLTEVRIAQQLGNREETSRLLTALLELDPANPEVLLETAKHKDLLAREAGDDNSRGKLVAEARTHYQLAAKHDSTAYAANLSLGQLLVREHRYPEALNHLQAALQLKKSDNLEQYVSRVRRAADRQEDKLKK